MNIELLISLIKDRPVIYDLKHPLNKDKDRKEKHRAWIEVCTIMDITLEVGNKKWKSLKDCYTKYLRSSSGATAPLLAKYMHWQWAKHMEFMRPHLNFGSTNVKLEQRGQLDSSETNQSGTDQTNFITNVQSAADELNVQASAYVLNNQPIIDVIKDQSQLSKLNVLTGEKFYNNTPRRRRRRTFRPVASTIQTPNVDSSIQYLEHNPINGFDATDLIFLGYAKLIKTFSIRRQARIKINIAQMITEEEIAHSEEGLLNDQEMECSFSPEPMYMLQGMTVNTSQVSPSEVNESDCNGGPAKKIKQERREIDY